MVYEKPPDFYCVILHMLTVPNEVRVSSIYWYIKESNEIFSIKPRSLLSLEVNARTVYFVKHSDSTVDPELIVTISNNIHFFARYPSDTIIKGGPFKLINLTLSSMESSATVTATLETASQVRWLPSPSYARLTNLHDVNKVYCKGAYFLPGRSKDAQKCAFDKAISEATLCRIIAKPSPLSGSDLFVGRSGTALKRYIGKDELEVLTCSDPRHEKCTCLFKVYPSNPFLDGVDTSYICEPIGIGNYFPNPVIGGGNAFTEERSDEGEPRDAIPRRIASNNFGVHSEAGILPAPCYDSSGSSSDRGGGVYPEERRSTPKSEHPNKGEGVYPEERARAFTGGTFSTYNRVREVIPDPVEDIVYNELYEDLYNAYKLKEYVDMKVSEKDDLEYESEGLTRYVEGCNPSTPQSHRCRSSPEEVRRNLSSRWVGFDFISMFGNLFKGRGGGGAASESQALDIGQEERNETAFVDPIQGGLEIDVAGIAKELGGREHLSVAQYRFDYDAAKEYFVVSTDEKCNILKRHNTI